MSENKTVDILKSAILLEMRGIAFYSQVASQTDNDQVREFFEMMAREEEEHRDILKNQLGFYSSEHKFKKDSWSSDKNSQVAGKIMNEKIIGSISAAGYEAAAIGAAINMEKAAVDLYSQRARESNDPVEKVLYKWLSEWESVHLTELQQMDKQLKESIWTDNNFWPF
ncbi:MAG: ferritin family protein [Deltaproteobacteria bacterium]|nr:ferritin family protein [Deltaproteobacteria bacterium]